MESGSTLRMLRRRHCRCNLLLLLAVCVGSAMVLLKWGFIDVVKNSTEVNDRIPTEMEGGALSDVRSVSDDNVENFAPPLHGAPPEDKEEEEEEENHKAKQSKYRSTTTMQPKHYKHPTTTKSSPPSKVSHEQTDSKEVDDMTPDDDDEHDKPVDENTEPAEEESKPEKEKDVKETDVRETGEKETGAGDNKPDASKDTLNVESNAEQVVKVDQELDVLKQVTKDDAGASRVSSTLLQDLGIKPTAPPIKEVHQEAEKAAPPPVVHHVVKTTPHVVKTTIHATTRATPTPTPYALEHRLPKVLLIGAVSCAVDVVVSFLHLHPAIVLGGVVNFFNDEANYKRGLNWYAHQMPVSYPNQVTIDVNPTYYLAGSTPERIFKMNPETKLLFVVCDPIMRALAHHINASQQQQFDSLAFHSSKDGRVNERYEAIQHSLYFYHMQRWLKVFPKKQLLVIDVGTLRKNLHTELSTIESFLGVEHNILNIPVDLDPSVRKKLQRFFQTHNEDFFKAIGRRFEWQ